MTTATDDPTSIIIKSDRTGRSRYTQEYKDEVVNAYEASGMSGPAFAEHCGLKYPTFASWVAKRRSTENTPPGGGPGRFLLAEIGPGNTDASVLHITFPGGAAAKLEDAGQASLLAELIRALA